MPLDPMTLAFLQSLAASIRAMSDQIAAFIDSFDVPPVDPPPVDPPVDPPPPPPVDPPPAPLDEHLAAKLIAPAATATLFVPVGETREITGFLTHGDVRVEGTLRIVAPCTLLVANLSIWHGTLEIGSAENPVTLDDQVEIIIRNLPITDPFELGRGIILHGKTRIYGQIPATRAVDVSISEAGNQVRPITILSESVVNRGHVMVLHNNDVVIEGTAFVELGRTRKDIPVTDMPNLGNLRGRYPLHFHHGGDVGRGRVAGCYVDSSPGLGIVIHDSAADVTNCVTYDIFGSHLFGESGSEVGSFDGNLCVKSTGAPESGSQLNDGRGNNDFGWKGHGIWTHGGGIAITNNVLSGHKHAISVLGEPGEEGAVFKIANFPAEIRDRIDPLFVRGWTGQPLGYMPIQEMPIRISGNRVFDSVDALALYFIQPLLHSVDGPVRSRVENENYEGRISLAYIGNFDLKNVTARSNNIVDAGLDHSSRGFDWTIENLTLTGFKRGLRCPTEGDNKIIGGHFDCETGIIIEQANHPNRKLHFDGQQTFGPRAVYGYSMEMTCFRWSIETLKIAGMPEEFWRVFFNQPADDWRRLFENDEVFVGDDRISHVELGDDFSFGPLLGLPDSIRLKADGTSHTTKSAREELGLVVGGRVLPQDAAPRAGHQGLFHNGPATIGV